MGTPSGYRSLLPVGLFLTKIAPRVSWELNRWEKQLAGCSDRSLLLQAMGSKRQKRFHSQGGSYYALYNPCFSRRLVTVIVALQTLSDYLDNLCDRGGIYHEAAFRSLHHSFNDALTLDTPPAGGYYRHYPYKKDGGYLSALVGACRCQLAAFPSYHLIQGEVLKLASLYCDLQVYKHLHPAERWAALISWAHQKAGRHPDLYWWEYAAACGSTLAIFALLAASTFPNLHPEESASITRAYFPWICGLHILLDYFIDQKEDLLEGDFNFVACYDSAEIARHRLQLFVTRALKKAALLPRPTFHRTIVQGLLAVYLSDPKVKEQGLEPVASELLNRGGRKTKAFYYLCRLLRQVKIL